MSFERGGQKSLGGLYKETYYTVRENTNQGENRGGNRNRFFYLLFLNIQFM